MNDLTGNVIGPERWESFQLQAVEWLNANQAPVFEPVRRMLLDAMATVVIMNENYGPKSKRAVAYHFPAREDPC